MVKKEKKIEMRGKKTVIRKFRMNKKLLSKPKRVETGTKAEAVEGTKTKKKK